MHRREFSKFLSDLRTRLPGNRTYSQVWAWILGDAIACPWIQKILVTHFLEHGFEVSPRDFIGGTAASNNPLFIHLRLLRNSLSRHHLDSLFFSTAGTTLVKDSKGKESVNASQSC